VANAGAEALPFSGRIFDVIVMVDAIHHITNLHGTIEEMKRVLKPHGTVLIFEPNKLNLLLWLLCLLDRNEWGALHLGSKRKYVGLFQPHFNIERMEYNGLLIGPDSSLNRKIVDLLLAPPIKWLLAWQAPKIFMVMTPKQP
jgi:SAM-dependent methyltransferase